jgi:ATPase family associated with various cellular activities (AAA)
MIDYTNSNIINTAQQTATDAARLTLFHKIKTGNTIVDAIITTLFLTFISYIASILNDNRNIINDIFCLNVISLRDLIKPFLFKKYSVTYEGKIFTSITYSGHPITSVCFTPSFRALWYDIIKNINDHYGVTDIKEFNTCDLGVLKNVLNKDIKSKYTGFYVVYQRSAFLYNREFDIYVSTTISSESYKGDDRPETKTENINITLYSYRSNLTVIKKYVDRITRNYIETVEESRAKKQYIYTLVNTKFENDTLECWSEYLFESTRTFDNMFFENKESVIHKLNFFLNNKKWYYDMGIPYSIGFGLYGPPGTGKTSFFKCLANSTGRHLVVIPLKLIKTRHELIKFFYEDQYNHNNSENSIGFDKKIIVFEDIDCLGEVVLRRDIKKPTEDVVETKSKDIKDLEEMLQDALENKDENKFPLKKSTLDDPITLDDILNLWDGLRETPGRIIGISSNHYEMLDPALTRPGRIDVTLKMDFVSTFILKDMFQKFYGLSMLHEDADRIKSFFYTPAEIINCFLMCKDDSRLFINRLAENKKF